jgi:hypothetical protein
MAAGTPVMEAGIITAGAGVLGAGITAGTVGMAGAVGAAGMAGTAGMVAGIISDNITIVLGFTHHIRPPWLTTIKQADMSITISGS